MSRGGNITVAILMWCAIAVYVVAATRHAAERRASITVTGVAVEITDTTSARTLTERKVVRWLAEEGVEPVGMSVRELDTRRIARALATHPEVREAGVWCDLEGRLTLRVEPRTLMMRVRTEGGYRFWLTDDDYILPDRGDFAAAVPVVTGYIPFPFSPGASGSYREMREADYRDYLERFTALAAERRELAARAASTRAEIRAARGSSPKRWWSAEKKKMFAEGRKTRIAELDAALAETTRAIDATVRQEAALKIKEKKSNQSFRFLSKLAKFVKFIESDRFWRSQIVQINVIAGGAGTEGGGAWREPQLELVPRVGGHTVLLGEMDGGETARLANLALFYHKAMWYEGWDAYDYINVKYSNQIVGTR